MAEPHPFPLKTAVRQAWCRALRDDRYQAGALAMRDFHERDAERWNPLGVLRDALGLLWGTPIDGPVVHDKHLNGIAGVMVRYIPAKDGSLTTPSDAELRSIGVPRDLAMIVHGAVYMAEKLTFPEIADWLELNTFDPGA